MNIHPIVDQCDSRVETAREVDLSVWRLEPVTCMSAGPAGQACALTARLAGHCSLSYRNRAVYVAAEAGAMIVWVCAPPSDQELKVYVFEPLVCGVTALMLLVEPMITVRVNDDLA